MQMETLDTSQGQLRGHTNEGHVTELSSTVGASNIVGVPVAIAFGGPGAVFWMLVTAFVGMATKYSEVVLTILFHRVNEVGEHVGGPMIYIEQGIKPRWLGKGIGVFMAGGLMVDMGSGIMVQANAARVDQPAKQGFWAIFGVFWDTVVICSISALVVLTTGVWQQEGLAPSEMPSAAFERVFGPVGPFMVNVSLVLFVLSTVYVLVYYGEKQAEFLFGRKASLFIQYIYIALCFVGAVGGLKTVWVLVDFMIGITTPLNLVCVIALSGQVVKATIEYFTSLKLQKRQ